MAKHMIPFGSTQDGERELIGLAFSEKEADDRKDWLRQFRVRLLFPPTLVMPLPFDILIACTA
jgi:transposase-like protein